MHARPTRPSRILDSATAVGLIGAVLFFVVAATWSFSSPLMSAPDEPAQTIKAVSVAEGNLRGVDIQTTPAASPWIYSIQSAFTVPAAYADLGRLNACFVIQPLVPATCAPDPQDAHPTARRRATSYVGHVPAHLLRPRRLARPVLRPRRGPVADAAQQRRGVGDPRRARARRRPPHRRRRCRGRRPPRRHHADGGVRVLGDQPERHGDHGRPGGRGPAPSPSFGRPPAPPPAPTSSAPGGRPVRHGRRAHPLPVLAVGIVACVDGDGGPRDDLAPHPPAPGSSGVAAGSSPSSPRPQSPTSAWSKAYASAAGARPRTSPSREALQGSLSRVMWRARQMVGYFGYLEAPPPGPCSPSGACSAGAWPSPAGGGHLAPADRAARPRAAPPSCSPSCPRRSTSTRSATSGRAVTPCRSPSASRSWRPGCSAGPRGGAPACVAPVVVSVAVLWVVGQVLGQAATLRRFVIGTTGGCSTSWDATAGATAAPGRAGRRPGDRRRLVRRVGWP